MDERLKLTAEQNAILEEFRSVLLKMEEAEIIIIKTADDPNAYVLNGKEVKNVAFQEEQGENVEYELVDTDDCDYICMPQCNLCLDCGEHEFKVEFKKDFYLCTDSESKVRELPEELCKNFKTKQEALNAAVDFVHQYDGEPYYVIVHVEDGRACETVETVENIPY